MLCSSYASNNLQVLYINCKEIEMAGPTGSYIAHEATQFKLCKNNHWESQAANVNM